MTRKALYLFGSILLAAGGVVACAGDGVDDNTGGTGNTTGGNNSGTGGTTTNNPGAGGSTTNNPGTGGTTGTGGSTTTPSPSAGTALTTVGGYHKAGPLNGYFWTAADMGGSTVLPKDYSVNGKICAEGSAAKVEGEAYGTTWGVLLGYNLDQGETPPNDSVAKALNGTVTIGLSGTVPEGTRLKLNVGGTDYCAPIMAGTNTVALSSLKKERTWRRACALSFVRR